MTRFATATSVLVTLTLAVCLNPQKTTAQDPPPVSNKEKDFILEILLVNKAHVVKGFHEKLLREGLPDPLLAESIDWDKQEEHTIVAINRGKPMLIKKLVNSGFWRRVVVRPEDNKKFELTDFDAKKKVGEDNKYIFTTMLRVDCVIALEMQDWFRNAKVIGGSAEATCRAIFTIECEITLTPVWHVSKEWVVTSALKVTDPKVIDTKTAYENLKLRKVGSKAAVGKPAEYFADKLVAAMKKGARSLEADLLNKANGKVKEKATLLLTKAINNQEFSAPMAKKEEVIKN